MLYRLVQRCTGQGPNTVMCPWLPGKIEGLGTASKPVATVTQPMLMHETSTASNLPAAGSGFLSPVDILYQLVSFLEP